MKQTVKTRYGTYIIPDNSALLNLRVVGLRVVAQSAMMLVTGQHPTPNLCPARNVICQP